MEQGSNLTVGGQEHDLLVPNDLFLCRGDVPAERAAQSAIPKASNRPLPDNMVHGANAMAALDVALSCRAGPHKPLVWLPVFGFSLI